MKEYKDDKMTIKKNDLDAIRLRPSMTIGFLNEAGVLHLCKEIIDNNRDECLKEESPGNQIDIEITDKYIESRDNGRGIPTKLLRIIHETSNAGSNMTRAGGETAGENGIGTTAYTALASELLVTTIRPQEKKKLTLTYREGKFIEENLEKYTGSDHGMITKFKPSKKILGIDYIPIDMLKEWLYMFNYTLPTNIKMNYTINGEKYSIKHRTIADYFKDNIPEEDWMSKVLEFEVKGDLIEIFEDEEHKRHLSAKIGFLYTAPEYKGETIVQTWMNMIYTSQNGVHLKGALNGYMNYMLEKICQKKKSLAEENKNLLKKDIMEHLQVVVIARCNFGNMFSAQAKQHVFPEEILNKLTDLVYEKMNEYSDTVNDFAEIIIANNRVRHEGEEARLVGSVTRKKSKWEKPKAFIPCSSLKTKEPKELYIVEGLSAGGGLRGARDGRFQAILQCRGKSLNVWDEDISRVVKSSVWSDLINILGCGIGASFDIRKLNFDKIIIATDADIDGYHIRVGNCAFFAKYMPEIIIAGKLYIAEPPLYKLQLGNKKEYIYVTSTREYIEECLKTISDVEAEFETVKMKASDFVRDSFNYLSVLREVSGTKTVDRYLLEFIANGFVKYGRTPENFIDNVDEWLRSLSNIYKEIGFDHKTNQVIATINCIDQFVIIDQELIDSLKYVIDVQEKYGLLIHYYSKKKQLDEQTTLSRFFEYTDKLYPVIKDRYKGLGSSSAAVSKETIMDPRTRRLIQVTIDDINDMKRTMSMLIGKGREDIKNRKELLMDFKFTKEDIDN